MQVKVLIYIGEMPKRNVWNKLQAHTNNGIPKIVEQMLKTAGYIGKLSLGAIDKTALKEIESFYSKDGKQISIEGWQRSKHERLRTHD